MAQYIGKTISLISVTENRYVGLLEGIDSEKGVVTLNKVRCFGTEGRKQWGPQEIYPNPNVYETVAFNGNDVKDLSILDISLDEVQPVLPPPEILAQQQQQQHQQHQQQKQLQQKPQQEQKKQQQQGAPSTIQNSQAPQNAQYQAPAVEVPAAVTGYGVYAPSAPAVDVERKMSQNDSTAKQQYPKKSQEARVAGSKPPVKPKQGPPRKVEIPNEDFDFQSNNSKLENDHDSSVPHQQHSNDTASNNDEAFYNRKSSFFDTISTSTETNTNMRWQEERELNMDTFGQASVGNRRGRGGFRGGRGSFRGGRGGQRGGNRGNARGGFKRNDNFGSASERVEF
ncbi:Scd6p LALA0_S01e08504g [Lachancea lanzarotensis]|uniref:LALA0S01e08504g1_1 n=1 Tax=Lachancea lanzarotensis TaxID=1245769 RepID=A0A0C7MXY5_9SACH|nr:uncharacterized protein LALA0_S01e08504g [Lachancea lanzarotensis]CEP60340.1 LALA0S01e08504g1_1 [Lachancea lanzarotensis]